MISLAQCSTKRLAFVRGGRPCSAVLTSTISLPGMSSAARLASNDSSNDTNSAPQKRRRQRHQFSKRGSKGEDHLEKIPSFQDFQRQAQVRSLYRHYLQLIYRHFADQSSRLDMIHQVRREFKQDLTDVWQVKRAISEGNRRLKELASMLGNSVQGAAREERSTSSTGGSNDKADSGKRALWPWQQQEAKNENATKSSSSSPKFTPYPPKSDSPLEGKTK